MTPITERTRDIFAESASVLYLSTHEYGIYPGTGPAGGRGDGEGPRIHREYPILGGVWGRFDLAAHDRIVERSSSSSGRS